MKSIQLTMCAAASYLFAACNPEKTTTPDYSNFIPVDSANVMVKSYQESIRPDTTASDTGGAEEAALNSLIMDAEELRTYLNENQQITKVKIMFAHTMDYIHAGNQGKFAGYKSGALTVVIAGYDKHENYVLAPGNMVPNHCIPCPDLCPTKGNAVSNLIE